MLLGRRSRHARFLPSAWSFPGGRLEERDGPPDDPASWRRCAARELFEESGIAIDEQALHAIGARRTPPLYPRGFDTRFFALRLDDVARRVGDSPQPEEIERFEVVPADDALAQWERNERRVPPPVTALLRAMAAHAKADDASLFDALRATNDAEEACPRLEPRAGSWIVPQRTRTLPPATHTNAYLTGGRRFLVVDPGSDDAEQMDRLVGTIRRREALGGRPEAIVLTHHHADHVAGATALAALLRIPLRAHPATRERLDARFDDAPWGEPLEEGASFDLEGRTLDVWHTPGHAPGHVVLVDLAASVAIVGDLISGISPVLIPRGEGSMGEYLRALERIDAAGLDELLPAHGPPLPGGAMHRALAHRRQRERRVVSALGDRPRSVDEIAETAYEGEEAPRGLARVQTLAHLEHLVERGLARHASGRWLAGDRRGGRGR